VTSSTICSWNLKPTILGKVQLTKFLTAFFAVYYAEWLVVRGWVNNYLHCMFNIYKNKGSGPSRWVWRCKVKTIQWMLQYLKVQFLKVSNSVGSVCISNRCGLASGSFPMLNARATIFEPLAPLTDNPLWHDTVPILHWHHSVHFDTWYTFSPQKWATALCSSLVQMKLGVTMFMARNSWQKWTIKVTPAPQW